MHEIDGRWAVTLRTLAIPACRQIVDALVQVPPETAVDLPEGAMPPWADYERDQFEIALVHMHLPRMAEPGFIEWDSTPFQAWRGEAFDEVAAVLTALQRYEEFPPALETERDRLGRGSRS